ncbi:MAG: ABC transporter permease subunit [Ruminiclostridium sp.]|nr:ABC transporter permease subunit [Ruminiclostridium sp.]
MRRNTKKVDIIIVTVILLLIAGGMLFALLMNNEQQNSYVSADTNGDGILSYKDYIGKRIGLTTGSSFEDIVVDYFPDSEYVYMESVSDMIVALEQNHIDAFLSDEPNARMIHSENSSLDYIKRPLVNDDYSFMFNKDSEGSEDLLRQFNDFLRELKDSGRFDKMMEKWFGHDDPAKTFDRTPSSGKNGELVVAGVPNNAPFCYFLNNEFTGCAVEIITLFGQKYEYSIKFEQPNVAALIAGVTSGKYDIAIGSISVTEERKDSAYFSDTVYNGGVMLMVRAEDLASAGIRRKASLSDFNGKTAGIITGSMHDALVGEKLPDSERLEFKTYSDLTEALLADKIDYFLMSRDGLNGLMAENNRIGFVDEPLDKLDVGAIFAKTDKGSKIRAQFDEFITGYKADGTLESIYEYWRSSEADGKGVDMSGLTGENGTLVFATTGDKPPVTYVANGSIAGTDPDIAARFCREYGYDIKVEIVDGGGFMSGMVSGVYDFAMADFVITEERKESVDFSVPYSAIELFVTARKEDTVSGAVRTETDEGDDRPVPAITFDRLNNPDCYVGVGTGTAAMFAVEKYLPEATEKQFPTSPVGYEALRNGTIDAFAFDRRHMQFAIDNGYQDLMLLDEKLGEDIEIAAGISRSTKIPGLKDKLNKFLSEIRADGTFDEIYTRWIIDNDYNAPEINKAASPEFTLVVGTCGSIEPYSFYSENALTGFDIELAKRFALWMNADIKFKDFDFLGLIAAAQSGDVDCIFANLNVTPERQEVIDFSDPIESIENAVMVRMSSLPAAKEQTPWIDSIVSSFEKNFIREERWKLIVEGIGTTCLITALSALAGSVLAFLICMFRRTGSKLANVISDIYVKLLQGTPIVVLLMILYYVILGKSGLEAVWVAVIGFSLNFGAYASEIMRSGIESIDPGQREAALALGYSENQAFFRFIFPQAVVRFKPVYKGEIVSLLKSTSIVGYIAIQDLTKMSDIIRSRTYEAFFPLIATAIIYFILAWIISLILKLLLRKAA